MLAWCEQNILGITHIKISHPWLLWNDCPSLIYIFLSLILLSMRMSIHIWESFDVELGREVSKEALLSFSCQRKTGGGLVLKRRKIEAWKDWSNHRQTWYFSQTCKCQHVFCLLIVLHIMKYAIIMKDNLAGC